MTKLVLHLILNAFAFFVAVTVLSGQGINAQGSGPVDYLVLAFIFGVINAVVRPILSVLGCPFIILTLGLGVLLINTLLFYLTGWAGTQFGVGFTVDGFWPAFLGALIVSVIGVIGNILIGGDKKNKK